MATRGERIFYKINNVVMPGADCHYGVCRMLYVVFSLLLKPG